MIKRPTYLEAIAELMGLPLAQVKERAAKLDDWWHKAAKRDFNVRAKQAEMHLRAARRRIDPAGALADGDATWLPGYCPM